MQTRVRICSTLLLLLCSAQLQAAPADSTRAFHALLAEQWELDGREFPEAATARGDQRYNDRLTDLSPEAVARRKANDTSVLQKLARIDSTQLRGQDKISYAVFATTHKQAARLDAMYGALPFGAADSWLPVSPMFGPQFELPQLVRETPFVTVRDYDNYLARLAAFPRQIDQMIARMQQGIASGWMPPAAAMQKVPEQIAAQLGSDVTQHLAYQPFNKFPPAIGAGEQRRLSDAGKQAIERSVLPAFGKLRSFMVDTYLPASRVALGASTLPGGPAYYQLMVAQQTTTGLTAQEIHQIGLQEVARINAEMETVVGRTGFKGSRAEFIKFINTDPKFLFTSSEKMLAAYRDIAKRVDAELPRLFAELPRVPYGIRAMQPYEGDNAEHYSRGSLDGSRAGYFEANVINLSRRSSATMESLLLHEAVPGHHLQIARQQELTTLPEFRRNAWFTAFGEGWALYAESLGDEIGMYRDPYAKFGQLSAEMHRACRLVIDTGIHAMGWGRDQSIAYLETNAALSPAFAAAEVDRYIVWPGQALGYKIGELRIKALRARAAAALGERFDLRRFHNAVIDNGVLPLDVLDQQIDLWIAAEQRRR
ncbi:uncharacterized protein (DUF885 family) [Actimicrobium sp. GrIS 1.19]|uniref:DUF885 domain-containing protein n=1 Tax=Actimicrobium sp. GrIS 1.19 TaxID=3071708 RepID=UPI002E0ABC7C|nr:uncharacterized protein (DUF885 family) [Actimicrobium sp. GrIS 1.19]